MPTKKWQCRLKAWFCAAFLTQELPSAPSAFAEYFPPPDYSHCCASVGKVVFLERWRGKVHFVKVTGYYCISLRSQSLGEKETGLRPAGQSSVKFIVSTKRHCGKVEIWCWFEGFLGARCAEALWFILVIGLIATGFVRVNPLALGSTSSQYWSWTIPHLTVHLLLLITCRLLIVSRYWTGRR